MYRCKAYVVRIKESRESRESRELRERVYERLCASVCFRMFLYVQARDEMRLRAIGTVEQLPVASA